MPYLGYKRLPFFSELDVAFYRGGSYPEGAGGLSLWHPAPEYGIYYLLSEV